MPFFVWGTVSVLEATESDGLYEVKNLGCSVSIVAFKGAWSAVAVI